MRTIQGTGFMNTPKSAVILAGGTSSRMKYRNKAFLKYKDKTIIEHVIQSVLGYEEILIVANDKEPYKKFGYQVIGDIYLDKGPLGGIHSALTYAKYEKVLVLACDMPNVNSELAQSMHSYDENYDALVSYDGVDLHPLFCIYDKRILPVAEKHIIENKLKLLLFLKEFDTRVFDWAKTDVTRNVEWFENINTPYDYRKLIARSNEGSEFDKITLEVLKKLREGQ